MNSSITIQLCAFCKHEYGGYFNCEACGHRNELSFIDQYYTAHCCEECDAREINSPITARVYRNPDMVRYFIRSGTRIEEIHPLTKKIETTYVTDEKAIVENNVVSSYRNFNEIRVCSHCRTIPDYIDYYPEVLVALMCEKDHEAVIKEYYSLFPFLTRLLPPETRRGILAHEWVEKIREEGKREILKNLRKNRSPSSPQLLATKIENKLYLEIIARDNFPMNI